MNLSSAEDDISAIADSAKRDVARPRDFGIDWWGMLTNPEFLKNPYPELNRIRNLAPVHYDPESGIYFVLGAKEFNQMAKSPKLGRDVRYWSNSWNSPENREREPEAYKMFKEFQPQMINTNPPDHRRMRDVYEKAYFASSMARHIPMIQEECARLIDSFPLGEPFDFMNAFAGVLPHVVSLNLFEIPQDMAGQVNRWIAALSWLGNIIVTSEQKEEARAAQKEFKNFLRGHLAGRKVGDGEAFLDLALAALNDGRMDEEETLNNVAMLISGSKTTPSLLGNGMLTLLCHPDQFTRLREDRGLLRSAIEEMLRFEPGSSIIPRAAVEDFVCGDVIIPKGSLAIGLVGAFSRDPSRFESPDAFDITRVPNPHMVFGGGAHVCIGKALARMTAQVAFTQLMDRFPRIELSGEYAWWTNRSDQRGLEKLTLSVFEDQGA